MTRSKDITNWILGQFETVGNDDALAHSTLITDLINQFPELIKDRMYGANRINQVLRNKEVTDKFKKVKGKDKLFYIIRNQQIMGESHETTNSTY